MNFIFHSEELNSSNKGCRENGITRKLMSVVKLERLRRWRIQQKSRKRRNEESRRATEVRRNIGKRERREMIEI